MRRNSGKALWEERRKSGGYSDCTRLQVVYNCNQKELDKHSFLKVRAENSRSNTGEDVDEEETQLNDQEGGCGRKLWSEVEL